LDLFLKQFFQLSYVLSCVYCIKRIKYGTYAPNLRAFLPALFFYYQMINMKQKEISQKEKNEINNRVIQATKQDLTHIQELKSN